MQDGPAIATLVLVVAVFATYAVLSRLGRRALHDAGAHLLTEHLVHWHFPPPEWRIWCERQRRALWFGALRPALRYLLPLLVLIAGLAVAAVRNAGLGTGLAIGLVTVVILLVSNTLLGPPLRDYLALSRRCRLAYDLYLDADGALEVWRDADGIRAAEAHPFTAGGARIGRVEAHGVAPAEIVITIVRPLAFGFQESEARFPVPDGRRAIVQHSPTASPPTARCSSSRHSREVER
jgi:hypothetical protein